jgi:hypothetical protein
MAGAEFHSIPKPCAQIPNPIMADRGVFSPDGHTKSGHTPDCRSQESQFESGLPQA